MIRLKKFSRCIKAAAITAVISTCFTGCELNEEELMDGKQIYFGNLHSHTAVSDGKGTADEALRWARDTAGFDFYAVTDHAESIFPWEWSESGEAVDRHNEDGQFVAIRGFEYSHAIMGHICVWDTDEYTNSILLPILPLFYKWLDGRDGMAQFNHPGREIGVFRKFEMHENVMDNMVALETGNKNTGNNDGEYLEWFTYALDRGWHVAPTSNQDNHSLTTNSHRTAVIADELSRKSILDSIASRRVYSTDDPDIRVILKYNSIWMGSTATVNGPAEITLTAAVRDNEPVLSIELFSNNGILLARNDYNDGRTETLWQPTVKVSDGTYVYLVVTGKNDLDADDSSDMQKAVTAPLWFSE